MKVSSLPLSSMLDWRAVTVNVHKVGASEIATFTSVRPHQCQLHLLTILGIVFACIIAVEELSIEELDSHHSEDELEESVDNEDIEHILERNDYAVKHGLQLGNSTNRINYKLLVKLLIFCHLLIVFKGRSTRNNFIAFNLWPVEVFLKSDKSFKEKVKSIQFKMFGVFYELIGAYSHFMS